MRYNSGHSRKCASRARFRVFIFVVLCLLLIAVLPFCLGFPLYTSPPDLSSCTRIEVQYYPSTLDYFIYASDPQNLLSPAEKKYLQSLDPVVVTDQERIKAFAHDVSLGSFHGLMLSNISYGDPVYIDCYRNSKHVIFFGVFGDKIITKGRRRFRYPLGLPNLEIIEPPGIRPFKLRGDCAHNMETLHTAGPLYRKHVSSYPEPNEWCDAIVRIWRNQYSIENGIKRRCYSEERISGVLTCPSVYEQIYAEKPAEYDEPNSAEQAVPLLECHYAMNPHCEPNSPPDMVLLFETKAGWNQHGGPELFTFDNHDPKGGCVLLNDGTVKFIRTKEELQQLRWK